MLRAQLITMPDRTRMPVGPQSLMKENQGDQEKEPWKRVCFRGSFKTGYPNKRGNAMNQKEIGELRRRLRLDKNNITAIYGCFVNSSGEIVACIDDAVSMLKQEETEVYLDRLRKCLSGLQERNLIDVAFTTAQVAGSEEHGLLTAVWRSQGRDEEARNALFRKIIDGLELPETNYVILLAADSYDVPYRGADDEEFGEGSEQVYRYFICAVCPVKDATADLRFFYETNEFHISSSGPVVGNTALGFLFPAFDDRATNLYNALYYAQKPGELHPELIRALFRTEPPMSAPDQKDTFDTLLYDTLEEDCSFEVAQSIHEQLTERMEQHKAAKDPEPLSLSAGEVASILRQSHVSDRHIDAFTKAAEEEYGDEEAFHPANLVGKKFEIVTPDVKISTSTEFSASIETRTLSGRKYLMIPVEDEVMVNGIRVKLTGQEASD